MIQALLVSSAIKIAANYLPSLATKLGGKRAESLAEDVVEAAIATVGLGKDATPDQVMKALEENKQAQQELQIRLAELDAKEHELIVRDRDSARAYQQAVGEEGRKRGNYMLAGVTGGLLACVVMVAWPRPQGEPLNPAVLGLITTIAGALLKMFSDAFAFEFGSSRGSKEKDEQIRVFQEQLETVGRENAAITRKVVNANVVQAAAPAAAALAGSMAGGAAAQSVADAVEKVEAAAAQATAQLAQADPDEPRPFVRALVEGRLDIGLA